VLGRPGATVGLGHSPPVTALAVNSIAGVRVSVKGMTDHGTEHSDGSRPGRRVIVVGASCSGKSTLGHRLAALLDVPFVELDALYWQPGWVGSNEDEFREKIREATAGDGWVVAGGYHRHTEPLLWPRVETIVWLDLPLRTSTWRILKRSWRRSREKELLWGTNQEKFWPQLKFWDADSLVTFTWKNHRSRRRRYEAAMADPRWPHIKWVRLRRQRELDAWLRTAETGSGEPCADRQPLPPGRGSDFAD